MSPKEHAFKDLTQYLDRHIQTSEQELQEGIETLSQRGMTEEQMAEVGNLDTLIQQNAELLFKGVKTIPMERITANTTEAERDRLAELDRQQPDASFKERRRIKKERAEIRQRVGRRILERVEQGIDAVIDKTVEGGLQEDDEDPDTVEAGEKLRYQVTNPSLFGTAAKRIRYTASVDHTLSKETRLGIIDDLEHIDHTSDAFQKRYGRTRFAAAVMKDRMAAKGPGQKYIQKRMERLEAQRKSTEKTLRSYQGVLGGALLDKTSMDRLAERKASLQRATGMSGREAEKEILKRGVVPATIKKIPQKVEEVKQSEAYKNTLAAVVDEFNQIGKNEAQSKIGAHPPITVQEAEKLIERYLTELAQTGEYRFRCSPAAFDAITNEKMKTQMETNTSGGLKNQGIRMGFTAEKFGCTPPAASVEENRANADSCLSSSEFETYGYVASSSTARELRSGVAQYGMVSVKLNKEAMKDRVTCVFGDSLDCRMGTQPSPVEHPSAASCNKSGKRALLELAYARYKQENTSTSGDPQAAITQANDFIKHYGLEDPKQRETKHPSYFELQFHGDVTARDMESLTIYIQKGLVKLDTPTTTATHRWETDEEVLRRKAAALADVTAKVQEINDHPEKYGRAGMPPLTVEIVYDADKYK